MKHVQSIIVIVIVAVFTDVVILCCRFTGCRFYLLPIFPLPFLPLPLLPLPILPLPFLPFTHDMYAACKVLS